tara:strand:+ start:5612 stop:6469 length:858 start_codon:yes stop_codon:yes gene_type:complete
MKIAALLPYPWQINIGKYFGKLGFYIAKKTRNNVRKNIEVCFPELSGADKNTFVKNHFEAVGAAFSEMGLGWFSSTNRLIELVKVEGIEHVERAREKGKGIIILAAHFTTLETSTSVLGEYFPGMKSIYRPQPNAMIDALIHRGRKRQVEEQIPSDNIRAMVRALRNNHSVCYLADLANKGSNSELIPFFGEPAITSTTVSKLAKITGATVLTYFFRRLPGKEGYVANIGAPLEDFPSDDVIADTCRLVRRLEDYIRLAPEQYMWTYRRFKGRPHPFRDIYNPEL